jgi:dihydroxyacetone kinase-like protein
MNDGAELFGEIDSKFGDGDHGVTVSRIAARIEENLARWEEDDSRSIREFLSDLGESIMAVGGGAAGPLYGALAGGFAEPLGNETEVDPRLLKEMFAGSLESIQSITNARVGDKTMMDAIIPATEAAIAAPDDAASILRAAAIAATFGADESQKYASKFGRARNYKEATIGTPDAGALSVAEFYRGLAEGFK